MKKSSVKIGLMLILILLLSMAVSMKDSAFAINSSLISLGADPSSVQLGGNVTLSGTISNNTAPTYMFPNENVLIRYKPQGGSYTDLATVKTDSNSRYTYKWNTTKATPIGTYMFNASWAGNATYTGDWAETPVAVEKISCQITLSANVTSVQLGNKVFLNGSISTVPANPSMKFPNQNVVIGYATTTITTVTTDSNSRYSYTWTPTQAGTYPLTATWQGNATYAQDQSDPATTVLVFAVSGQPTISIGNYILYTNTTFIGDRFNATVSVKDVSDLFGYQVDLTVDDTALNITRAWRPTWSPQWVFAGKSTISPDAALHDFDSNGYFENVWVGDTMISGTTFNGAGLLAIIEFKILSTPPKGIGNKVFSILNISSVDTYVLNSLANVMFSVKTNGYYELNWAKPASQVSINVNPATANLGQVITISGKIETLPPNASVKFPSVTVRIWRRAGTSSQFTNTANATTNATSGYSSSWTSDSAGTHGFKASWAGNINYTSAESRIANVTINKLSSTITLNANPTSVKVGDDVTLSGAITPARSGVTVTISRGTTTIATTTTISDGTYSTTWKTTDSGTFELKASWAGDATYAGADSNTRTVEVAAPPLDYLYYIIAAIVIIIVVALIAIYLLRKRRKTA